MSDEHVFSHRVFRAVFLASVVSNVGTFIQDVGEAWLMVKLGGSALQIALVSATTWFPAVVFTLPAGVLADQLDRRRVLISAQAFMALTALGLAYFSFRDAITPAGLLVATTSLGVGAALNGPAWSTLVPELVPPRLLPDAIAVQALNWNIARAVGPALGGLLVARLGPTAAFVLNAVSFVGVLVVMARTERRAPSAAREPMTTAILAGLSHFRGDRDLRAVMSSTAVFGFFGSALLSLLPAFVAHDLGLSSGSFGLVLGAFGTGALLAAVSWRRLRARFPPRVLVPSCMAVHALSTLLFSRAPSLPWAIVAIVPAGMAWLTILSSQNTSVQLVAPAWVRGRIKSIDNLLFLGAYAVGGALGGFLANRLGVRSVLLVSSCGVLFAALFGYRADLPNPK